MPTHGAREINERPGRRLRRTFSAARWTEYRELLVRARAEGYELVALEDWLDRPKAWSGTPILLLRHDVDQHPRTALRMSGIEQELGVTSTWYFRWRTARADVIAELRRRGCSIGLHYETLSRQVLARPGMPETEVARLVPGARHVLRGEIAAFQSRYGAIDSVCPHGDTRVAHVSNAELLHGEDWTAYDVRFDAQLAMRDHRLGAWMTDRSRAHGGWSAGMHPESLLREQVSPILCLVHPNNWASGASLWADRLAAAALPSPGHDPARLTRLMRTSADTPPI